MEVVKAVLYRARPVKKGAVNHLPRMNPYVAVRSQTELLLAGVRAGAWLG